MKNSHWTSALAAGIVVVIMVCLLSCKIERTTYMEQERGSPIRTKPQEVFHIPICNRCTNRPYPNTSSRHHSHTSHHPCTMPSPQHSLWTPSTAGWRRGSYSTQLEL
uniref:PR domain containing 16 n=1 Tax=Nothobranchius korthausae TaxID=1143690 RepID=A0A1A8GNQ2_9TELE